MLVPSRILKLPSAFRREISVCFTHYSFFFSTILPHGGTALPFSSSPKKFLGYFKLFRASRRSHIGWTTNHFLSIWYALTLLEAERHIPKLLPLFVLSLKAAESKTLLRSNLRPSGASQTHC